MRASNRENSKNVLVSHPPLCRRPPTASTTVGGGRLRPRVVEPIIVDGKLICVPDQVFFELSKLEALSRHMYYVYYSQYSIVGGYMNWFWKTRDAIGERIMNMLQGAPLQSSSSSK